MTIYCPVCGEPVRIIDGAIPRREPEQRWWWEDSNDEVDRSNAVASLTVEEREAKALALRPQIHHMISLEDAETLRQGLLALFAQMDVATPADS